jgi:predicted AAA+ superfamily ATPase
MIIIHGMNASVLPRLASAAVHERLKVMPAVVVTGPRQTGKSTLVQEQAPGRRAYVTLDDLDAVDLARRDPAALWSGAADVTIDEVQREPSLLRSIKRAIDHDRHAGRFLLTGSANLFLMRGVSDSLAGRASYLTLWPMTRREQLGDARAGLWPELLAADETTWPHTIERNAGAHADWRDCVRRGGFPTPALHLSQPRERQIWLDGYVRTYLERDLQELAAITALPDFRRLMRAACHRIGQMLNQTELGRDVALPQPTVHRYLNLLETSYLLVRLPAFAKNRTKRLIKSPKLYWGDTGVAVHLAGSPEPDGAHLENLVLADLLAWRDASLEQIDLHYWRTTTGTEVDFVIESGGKLLPIEVKATARPRLADASGLIAFRSEYGKASRPGLLLHTGHTTDWLAPGILAAPWWQVL